LERSITPVEGHYRIFQEAYNQDIDLAVISKNNLDILSKLGISNEAKIRIIQAITKGNLVIVPKQMTTIFGKKTIGWFEIDPVTGILVDTNEKGQHQGFIEHVAKLKANAVALLTAQVFGGIGTYVYIDVKCVKQGKEDTACIRREKNNIGSKGSSLLTNFLGLFDVKTPVRSAFAIGIFIVWLLYNNSYDPPLPPMLVGITTPPNAPIPPIVSLIVIPT
jgi:hypothetical protein